MTGIDPSPNLNNLTYGLYCLLYVAFVVQLTDFLDSITPEVLAVLQCTSCRSATQLVSNKDSLRCSNCGVEYPLREGYLDLLPHYEEQITPIQHLLQFKPAILLYDNLWRPFGYFLTSGRSFSRDLVGITKLMAPERHRLVLDLACGPGNFTRSVARCGEGIQVVGFDLARGMLERAGRLTVQEQYPNVRYIRGSALSLPFRTGVFDGVICCGALQLFTDYDQSLAEISRVLKVGGEFVCQTIVGPNPTPLWLDLSDRLMKFGHFKMDEFKRQLGDLRLAIVDEELSRASYIFRAAKAS